MYVALLDSSGNLPGGHADCGNGDYMTDITPPQVKGGTFANRDINLIKKALSLYAQTGNPSDDEIKQIVNLMHRLKRIVND